VIRPSGVLDGNVDAPGEGRVLIHMATGRIDPTEEAIGDLPRYEVVIEREGGAGFHATRIHDGEVLKYNQGPKARLAHRNARKKPPHTSASKQSMTKLNHGQPH
jgi:hypothetical protein